MNDEIGWIKIGEARIRADRIVAIIPVHTEGHEVRVYTMDLPGKYLIHYVDSKEYGDDVVEALRQTLHKLRGGREGHAWGDHWYVGGD